MSFEQLDMDLLVLHKRLSMILDNDNTNFFFNFIYVSNDNTVMKMMMIIAFLYP